MLEQKICEEKNDGEKDFLRQTIEQTSKNSMLSNVIFHRVTAESLQHYDDTTNQSTAENVLPTLHSSRREVNEVQIAFEDNEKPQFSRLFCMTMSRTRCLLWVISVHGERLSWETWHRQSVNAMPWWIDEIWSYKLNLSESQTVYAHTINEQVLFSNSSNVDCKNPGTWIKLLIARFFDQ